MEDSPAAPVANHHVSLCIGEVATVRKGDILVHPIDFDAQVSGMPNGMYLKGFMANRLALHVGATRPEAHSQYIQIHPERFPMLHKVPAYDVLRRIYDAARLSHPDVLVAEAIRRVGWSMYESFLGSLLGRMLFGAMGKDLEAIFRFAPNGFSYVGNTVRIVHTQLGGRHFRYDYDPCFTWLDSYQIGIIEGAAAVCGHCTELKVHLTGPYHGSIECRWF